VQGMKNVQMAGALHEDLWKYMILSHWILRMF